MVKLLRNIGSALLGFSRREPLLVALIAMFGVLELVTRWSVPRIVSSVEWSALSMIVALLIVTRAFEFSGQLVQLTVSIVKLFRGRVVSVMLFTMLACAVLSAFLMNDTTLFVFVPLVVALIKIARLEPAPFIALISSYANAGSSLTPIGNPQNIIIWQHYSLSFLDVVKYMSRYVAAFIVVLSCLLVAWIRRGVKIDRMPVPPSVAVDKKLGIASVIALIVVVIMARAHLALYTPIVAIVALAICRRMDVIKRVDYVLIAIFLLFFIDFAMLGSVVEGLILHFVNTPLDVLALSIAMSIAMSNVPATIVLIHAVSSWKPLLVGVNVAGFATSISSLANLIAIRLSGVSQREFHKYSLPIFCVCLLVAMILFIL